MLRLIRSVLKFSATIVTTSYSYNKLKLLIAYYRLIIQSVYYHKFSKGKTNIHRASLLDHVIQFDDYGSFINMFEEIFILQIYKAQTKTPDPVIIDCGSNIGMSILYFRLIYPSAVIEAFEPDPKTFEILKRNIEYNKIKSVILHNTALGNKSGTTSFFRSTKSTNSGLLRPGESIETLVVPIQQLSTVLTGKVSILKIDTEGSEQALITDLINSGKIQWVSEIVMEFHPALTEQSLDDFIEQLRAIDFHLTVTGTDDANQVMIHAVR
jgi:FkbM family methyltransferase